MTTSQYAMLHLFFATIPANSARCLAVHTRRPPGDPLLHAGAAQGLLLQPAAHVLCSTGPGHRRCVGVSHGRAAGLRHQPQQHTAGLRLGQHCGWRWVCCCVLFARRQLHVRTCMFAFAVLYL